MPVFQSTDQFYACMQAVFDEVARSHPQASDSIARSQLIIRLRCQEPTGEILINGRNLPPETRLGFSRVRPDLDVELSSDTLHEIMLGEMSLTKAIGSKQMNVRGPVYKALTLAELFKYTQKVYPDILVAQGLT